MRSLKLAPVALAVAAAVIPQWAAAQLEEVIVTATRRETDLQSTPISIQAFTAEELWRHIPGAREMAPSVHLTTFDDVPAGRLDADLSRGGVGENGRAGRSFQPRYQR